MYRRKKDPEYYCHFARIDAGFPCHGLSTNERELEAMLYEVICKFAQTILNIDDSGGSLELSVKMAQQAGYEQQIQGCQDHKRRLYERLMLGEIQLDDYKVQKAAYDAKLKDLNRLHSALSVATKQMQMDGEEQSKLHNIAREAAAESGLTRKLADKLIDRVFIYPGNRVEIVWKIRDFALDIGA